MAWTTPVTWTAGQVVGASDLNAQIRDNMNFLLSQKVFATILYHPASNYSIAAAQATFVGVDTTHLRFSVVSTNGRVRGTWTALPSCDNTAHTPAVWLNTLLDAATLDQADNNGTVQVGYTASTGGLSNKWVTYPFSFTGLATVTSHTYDMAWRNDSSAGIAMSIIGSATVGIRGEIEEF